MVAILEIMGNYKELQGRTIGGKPAIEVITRRNERIVKLFEHHGISVRLIGDVEKPAIIMDEQWCLSCWAKNFELIFNDAPRGGNTLYTFKLTDKIDPASDVIKEYVKTEQYHRPVYRVALGGSGLFLAGHNFKNRKDSTGRYPVFSRINPKIYYTKDRAEELVDELEVENYNAVVI